MMAPIEFGQSPALALYYADPGSGALLWQLIGSFVIGLLFYLRRFAAWISPSVPHKASQDAVSHEK